MMVWVGVVTTVKCTSAFSRYAPADNALGGNRVQTKGGGNFLIGCLLAP